MSFCKHSLKQHRHATFLSLYSLRMKRFHLRVLYSSQGRTCSIWQPRVWAELQSPAVLKRPQPHCIPKTINNQLHRNQPILIIIVIWFYDFTELFLIQKTRFGFLLLENCSFTNLIKRWVNAPSMSFKGCFLWTKTNWYVLNKSEQIHKFIIERFIALILCGIVCFVLKWDKGRCFNQQTITKHKTSKPNMIKLHNCIVNGKHLFAKRHKIRVLIK